MSKDLKLRILFITCSAIIVLIIVVLLSKASSAIKEQHQHLVEQKTKEDKRSHREHMMTLYPSSYRDSSGTSSIKLAEKTIYCFDSVKNKQWVESSNQMIFQRLVADLRHTQANVSLNKSLDSVFVAVWDNVYYIPRYSN